MPKAMQFRANSVIYFQGDSADKIYILQAGKVSLNYSDIETGQDVHDLVQAGEFFGVKSALGRYPREENALVLQDSACVAFTVPEFEQMAMQNTRIVMKMLKVFSNQLRRFHRMVSNLLDTQEQLSPEIGLYNTGEYYLKNRQYDRAKYIFSRYLTYYPAGKMAGQAAKNLEIVENASGRYGQGHGPSPIAGVAASVPKPERKEMSSVTKNYYDSVSLYSQGRYAEALQGFQRIADANDDPEFSAKSVFDVGRCLFMTGKYDDCVRQFTRMITSYPKHPSLPEALYYMAQSYEKNSDQAKAVGFYKKILSMSGDEDDMIVIKARKALRALEG